jgi:predicted AAA+ superfamily ATPase
LYHKRILEKIIEKISYGNIAICISGPKGCGKTETCKQYCKTIKLISQTDNVLEGVKDNLILGEQPILIDE